MNLAKALSQLHPFKVLVLGDFLLDAYTTGRVKRISPEAPVPVMEVVKCESRPGGAGNVALNLAALGGSVLAAGRIGAHAEGEELKRLLVEKGVDGQALLVEPNYRTPVKNRLIAESQQLLRLDFETIAPLDPRLEEALLEKLEVLIPQVQIVALSDYGKGGLTPRLISGAISLAKKWNIPSIVDPKGVDFAKYKGASLLKPNLSEAYAASKMAPTEPLETVAKQVFSMASVEQLLITRSEAGMSLFDAQGKRADFSVRSREVKDVTGAGDTVLAILCLALANRLGLAEAIHLANLAAGIAVERVGCVQVTLPEIAKRFLEDETANASFG